MDEEYTIYIIHITLVSQAFELTKLYSFFLEACKQTANAAQFHGKIVPRVEGGNSKNSWTYCRDTVCWYHQHSRGCWPAMDETWLQCLVIYRGASPVKHRKAVTHSLWLSPNGVKWRIARQSRFSRFGCTLLKVRWEWKWKKKKICEKYIKRTNPYLLGICASFRKDFFRNQSSLDYLCRWRYQSCQIFFQSVHSDVFGKG